MKIPTPRFVTTFKVAGTKSYRLAASKFMDDFGGNAQNPAECVLRLLRARAGHSFVQPDQSGAEALIVAMLAPPGNYRRLFEYKVKPHTFLALHLFYDTQPQWFHDIEPAREYVSNTDPAIFTKLPGWKTLNSRIQHTYIPYYVGKRTAHARSYKMGWRTFQTSVLKDSEGRVALSAADAKRFLEMFDMLFPEIIQWQNEVIFTARRDRELVNLFGYPRRFEQIFHAGYEREIVSWIPQSTVGCLTTEAILALDAEMPPTWNILNNKHDSLLLEVPDADVDAAARMSSDKIKSFELTGRDGIMFRMKSSVQVGKNWAKHDEKNNPAGMKDYDL
jgi:hypothetical protein